MKYSKKVTSQKVMESTFNEVKDFINHIERNEDFFLQIIKWEVVSFIILDSLSLYCNHQVLKGPSYTFWCPDVKDIMKAVNYYNVKIQEYVDNFKVRNVEFKGIEKIRIDRVAFIKTLNYGLLVRKIIKDREVKDNITLIITSVLVRINNHISLLNRIFHLHNIGRTNPIEIVPKITLSETICY